MHDGRKRSLSQQRSSFINDAKAFMDYLNPPADSEPPKYRANPWKRHLEEKAALEARVKRLYSANHQLKIDVSNLEANDAITARLYKKNKDLEEKSEELEMQLNDSEEFKDGLYKRIEELKQKNAELQADYEGEVRSVAEHGRQIKRNREAYEKDLRHEALQSELRVKHARMEGHLSALQQRRENSSSPRGPSLVPPAD